MSQQAAVFDVAVELARQDKRLGELASAIPLPGDFDPDILPSTVEFELYSRIQAVKADYLQPTIAVLMEAAQLSEAALRLKFAQTRVSSCPRGDGGATVARRVNELMPAKPAAAFSETLRECVARPAELLSMESMEGEE
jgi:hypothetical protein